MSRGAWVLPSDSLVYAVQRTRRPRTWRPEPLELTCIWDRCRVTKEI